MNTNLVDHKLQKYRYKLSTTKNKQQAILYSLKIQRYQKMNNQTGGADEYNQMAFDETIQKLQKAENDAPRLMSVVEELKTKIGDITATHQRNMESFDKLCRDLIACQQRTGQSDAEAVKLREELEKLKNATPDKDKQIKSLQENLDKLIAESRKVLTANDNLSKTNDELRDVISKLQQMNVTKECVQQPIASIQSPSTVVSTQQVPVITRPLPSPPPPAQPPKTTTISQQQPVRLSQGSTSKTATGPLSDQPLPPNAPKLPISQPYPDASAKAPPGFAENASKSRL